MIRSDGGQSRLTVLGSTSPQDLNKRQGLALLTKVGESVKHVAGGYKLRARPPEFCAMGEYLDTFSQKLGTIDRIAQRILKEQSGTGEDPRR